LDYEKPVSTGAQAKILIGSFLPFSTVSALSGLKWYHSVVRFRGKCRYTSSGFPKP
jgi:hypothetical protein